MCVVTSSKAVGSQDHNRNGGSAPTYHTNLCRCPRAGGANARREAGGKVKGEQSRSKVEEGAADARGAVTPMMNNKMLISDLN